MAIRKKLDTKIDQRKNAKDFKRTRSCRSSGKLKVITVEISPTGGGFFVFWDVGFLEEGFGFAMLKSSKKVARESLSFCLFGLSHFAFGQAL